MYPGAGRREPPPGKPGILWFQRIKEILRRMLNRRSREQTATLLPDVLAAIEADQEESNQGNEYE
jgi:hypothetical protein